MMISDNENCMDDSGDEEACWFCGTITKSAQNFLKLSKDAEKLTKKENCMENVQNICEALGISLNDAISEKIPFAKFCQPCLELFGMILSKYLHLKRLKREIGVLRAECKSNIRSSFERIVAPDDCEIRRSILEQLASAENLNADDTLVMECSDDGSNPPPSPVPLIPEILVKQEGDIDFGSFIENDVASTSFSDKHFLVPESPSVEKQRRKLAVKINGRIQKGVIRTFRGNNGMYRLKKCANKNGSLLRSTEAAEKFRDERPEWLSHAGRSVHDYLIDEGRIADSDCELTEHFYRKKARRSSKKESILVTAGHASKKTTNCNQTTRKTKPGHHFGESSVRFNSSQQLENLDADTNYDNNEPAKRFKRKVMQVKKRKPQHQERDASASRKKSCCNICGKAFLTHKYIKEHQMRVHPEHVPKQLPEEKAERPKKKTLIAKSDNQKCLTDASPKKSCCNICGKAFLTHKYIKEHQMRVHPEHVPEQLPEEKAERAKKEKSIAKSDNQECLTDASPKKSCCNICGKAFLTHKYIKEHQMRVHPEHVPEQLSEEEAERPKKKKSIAKSDNQECHTDASPKKRHHCTIGGKTFAGLGYVKNHQMRVHPTDINVSQIMERTVDSNQEDDEENIKPRIRSKVKLMQIKKRKSIAKSNNEERDADATPRKRYICTICDKTFSVGWYVKSHQKRVHPEHIIASQPLEITANFDEETIERNKKHASGSAVVQIKRKSIAKPDDEGHGHPLLKRQKLRSN